MEVANQIFFVVFGVITLAIVLSAIPQFQSSRVDWPSFYWPLSTSFYAISALSFGLALWVNKFLLTIANASLLMSAVALICLYRSWNGKPFNKIQTLLIWLLPLGIAILYEPLRTTPDTFLQRVALITLTLEVFIVWQLLELIKFYKKEGSRIVGWLAFITLLTLMGNVLRTYQILTGDGPKNIFLYTEEPFGLALRWLTYATNIIAFVALGVFYLQKQITKENKIANALESSKEENEKITELLKEKERLIYGLMKANITAATGALSASIAHELNQPLGASLLNIQFLKMLHESGKLTPELTSQLLNQLEGDAKRSGNIIRSLQSIFTKDTVEYEIVSLNEVLSSALDIYKLDLISKDIKVTGRVDEDISVTANKGQLLQVLINLVNNAIQALSQSDIPNKNIQVNCLRQDKNCIVEIIDNGPGISKEKQKQLFELLNTDKSKGMGLGLWLCSQIMNNFGGNILYEDALGGGAKFILTFPTTPPRF